MARVDDFALVQGARLTSIAPFKPNTLGLENIYQKFSCQEIEDDISLCKAKIKSLIKIISEEIRCETLEKYLSAANEFLLLADKLYAYARINLYIDMTNKDAIKLQVEASTLKKRFQKIETQLANKLSPNRIRGIIKESAHIAAHEKYFYNLIKFKPIPLHSKASSLEAPYLKLVGGRPLLINGQACEVDRSYFGLYGDKIKQSEYLGVRKAYFCKIQDSVAASLVKIKRATLSLARSENEDPLSLSLRSAKIHKRDVRRLLQSIDGHKNVFQEFLNFPFTKTLQEGPNYPLDEIKSFIISAFFAFNQEMGDFATEMFRKGYIDFSETSTRIVGSRHLKILARKESRIISRYDGSIKNIFDIAHELGHAYQNHCIMKYESPINSNIPVSTCEIGAIFCELIVYNYLTSNPRFDGLALLVQKIFLNYLVQAILGVRARFIFEQDLFCLIKRGQKKLGPNDITKLMTKAQKAVFNNDAWIDPFLWIYKPHFYSVNGAYYSYPYAFGALCALIAFYRCSEIEKLFYLSGSYSATDLAQLLDISASDPQCFDDAFDWIEKNIQSFLVKSRASGKDLSIKPKDMFQDEGEKQ